MRVVVDGGSWTNHRGFGRFTREIVGALAQHGRHEYVLVVEPGADAEPHGRLEVAHAVVGTAPSRAASANGWRSGSDLWRMSRAITKPRGDAIFFPCVYSFVPVWTDRPIVTGVHDAIAERFPELVFPSLRSRWFWRAKMRAALWQSSRVVTVSDHARKQVQAWLGVPEERLRTVNEAAAPVFREIDDRALVRETFAARGLDADAPTFFYVGGLAPHKNLERVIRAFAAVTRSPVHASARLVMVSDQANDVFHSAARDLHRLVDDECPGRAIFVGGVCDEELARLLSGARGLVLASFDEGFGLPGIEAAACGAPVIATTASAMPEILGDAALYVDPWDEASIASAFQAVLADDDARRRWGHAARERAQRLTWRLAAEKLDAVFDELAVERRDARR